MRRGELAGNERAVGQRLDSRHVGAALGAMGDCPFVDYSQSVTSLEQAGSGGCLKYRELGRTFQTSP